MVDQMAVEYVKNEYEAVGMDLDSIQMRCHYDRRSEKCWAFRC